MKTLSKSLALTLLSSVGLLGLNFVTGVLTARLLDPAGRGEQASLQMWALTLALLAGLGFSEAMTYLQARYPHEGPRLLGTTFIAAALLGTLGLVVAEIIIPHAFATQGPEVVRIGQFFMLSLFMMIGSEAAKALISGDHDFEYLNLIRLAQPLLTVPTLLILWKTHHISVATVLITASATGTIVWILMILRLKKRVGLGRPSVALFKEGLYYGIRLIPALLGKYGNIRLDLLIMPVVLAASPIGLYSVAVNVSLLVIALLGNFSLVVFPAAARAGQEAGLAMVARTLRLVLLAGTGLAGFLFLIAPPLLTGIYGHEFAGAVLPFRILLLGAVAITATGMTNSGLQAINRPAQASLAQGIGLGVTAIGLLCVLRPYGIIGAAWVSSLANVLAFLVSLAALGQQPEFAIREVLSLNAFRSDLGTVLARVGALKKRQAIGRESPNPDGRNRKIVIGVAALLLFLTVPIMKLVTMLTGDGGLQLCLLLVMVIPPITLALADSDFLMTYVLAIWAFSPEVRRLFDWGYGQYQPITVLSIAPLLATLTLIIPLLKRPIFLSPSLGKALGCLGIALAYGTVIGMAHNGIGCLFDLGNYALPLLVLLYAAARPLDLNGRDRQIRAAVGVTVLIAAYGWVQFLTAPPWDRFWMEYVPMYSNYSPEPLKLRMFSTLNSPGPCATWLAAFLAPMLLEKRWRGSFGWIGVVIVTGALLFTLGRSAWLQAVESILIYIAFSAGRERFKNLAVILTVAVIFYFAVPYLPGGEAINDRLQSFSSSNLQDDQSYNVRNNLLVQFLPTLLDNPIGAGLGTVGQGSKIDNGGELGQYGNFDNGLYAVILTFGIVGSIPFFLGLWFLMRHAYLQRQEASLSPYARLALATLLASILTLISGNLFNGVTAIVVWFLYSAIVGIKQQEKVVPSTDKNNLEYQSLVVSGSIVS